MLEGGMQRRFQLNSRKRFTQTDTRPGKLRGLAKQDVRKCRHKNNTRAGKVLDGASRFSSRHFSLQLYVHEDKLRFHPLGEFNCLMAFTGDSNYFVPHLRKPAG